MAKAIIRLGYENHIMEASVALLIAEAIADGERYETKGYGDDKTYHVWDNDGITASIELLPETVYRVGKMAGKPGDK